MALELKALAPADAIQSLATRGKQLSPTFSWQDAYGADHATMFTVARSAGFDILQDIQNGLSKALQEGRTFRDFSKELTPLLQAKGWWGKQFVEDPATGDKVAAQLGSTRRLQTIFDTNMRVSYAAGHWANFQRNKAARPYLRYVHLPNQENPRLQHQAWNNICLPVDHPWWNTHACPNGWHCHCTLQSLSQREVDQMQSILIFDTPPDQTRSWVNKRTGEVLKIPVGIDPGWDHNPGKTNAAATANDALAQKAAGAPLDLVVALVDERVRSDAFAAFLENPQGSMPVMPIPPEVAAAIGTEAKVAVLSSDTMTKQLLRHPELTKQDYLALPSIGATPTLVFTDGDNTFVLVKAADGRWRYVAAKTTRTGKAAFVTSYRFASDADIRRKLGLPGITILIDRREK